VVRMGLTIFDESRAAFIENILTGNNEVVGVAVQQPCALFARTGTVDLAFDFLEKFTRELDKSTRTFSPQVLDLFEEYDWPGNVRELENVIQRMVVLADPSVEVIEAEMVPAAIRQQARARQESSLPMTAGEAEPPEGSMAASSRATDGRRRIDSRTPVVQNQGEDAGSGSEFSLPPEGLRLSELEANLIRQALERAGGRLEPAARLLGITYKTLQYRVKKYGLQAYQKQESPPSKETRSLS